MLLNYALIQTIAVSLNFSPSFLLFPLLVALVMYWFSARLLPLRAAHCWQCLGLPAGFTKQLYFEQSLWQGLTKSRVFFVQLVLLAREKLQHKFTT